MRKHATMISTPNGTTANGTTAQVDPLIVSPVSTRPRDGGGLLSLRPRGA